MVTMPSEAAADYALVRELLASGMDCMRINCAHDRPPAWAAMIAHLRRAEAELGRACRVAMDLAGPKLRTGPLAPGPRVLKVRPHRDDFGRVVDAARVRLVPSGADHAPAEEPMVPVAREWMARLAVGDQVHLTDARGARRRLRVVAAEPDARLLETARTVYFATGLALT